MKETIGRVIINYDYYTGKDYYSDGAVEDEILEIVQNYPEEEYNKVIAQRKSWPILYHLSHLRSNIVRWLPVQKTDKILEVGAGCGAITGGLADTGAQITCIDLSKRRSLINAYRNRDKRNIEIIVGNFADVEPNLTKRYDIITLIGVFEYGQAYIPGDRPYETFLKTIARHLAPGGKIVIAIENKFGLKYWAGCKEDHVGKYFEGIEGYPTTSGVRTFSRKELEDLAKQCGFCKWEFYYPYPDYKFPLSIYSDQYLPKQGELLNNLNNMDRDRAILFNEAKVFDMIIEEEMFPFFSNSYLMVLETDKEL
ncbi:class I SAM-dependent methyltransferase [Diplocloster hominis]|uniref:class I SAM-dependent methyltransferase n=1 Tax=Diplocloster hominis TaxID=3079010 RepID=UPI0031B9B249